MERERTSSELMSLSIRLHFAKLSLSNTASEFKEFGVERSRKAVHDWVQKADIQPVNDASPDHVVLDATVTRIDGQQISRLHFNALGSDFRRFNMKVGILSNMYLKR